MGTDRKTGEPEAGIIFDMNGTMVDDARYQRAAWQNVCARHGRPLSDEDYSSHVAGHNEADVLTYLFGEDYPEERGEAIAEEKRKVYQESFDPADAEVRGLRDLLNELETRGTPLALATSASRPTMDFILDTLQLRRFFHKIVQANEVARGKPNPDIYLRAAEQIGVPPKCCVVLEDSSAGVKSAKAAGMRCIGLVTTLPAHRLVSDGADLAIRDFTEVSVDDLLSLAKKS